MFMDCLRNIRNTLRSLLRRSLCSFRPFSHFQLSVDDLFHQGEDSNKEIIRRSPPLESFIYIK